MLFHPSEPDTFAEAASQPCRQLYAERDSKLDFIDVSIID